MTAEAQAPTSGRRANTGHVSYMEGWAERHYRAQVAVERDRLKQGKAKYRAHREPLKTKPEKP